MALLKVSNLCKTYYKGENKIYALRNINFDVEEGEFVSIVGKSGSGKSTLLNLLGGMDTSAEGSICVGGINILTMSEKQLSQYRKFTVGMIFPAGSHARQDRLYIHGSKSSISSDVAYNQAGELCYTIISEGKKIERKVTAKQNYALESSQFGRCIENGESPFVTSDLSIKNAKLLDRILEKIGY